VATGQQRRWGTRRNRKLNKVENAQQLSARKAAINPEWTERNGFHDMHEVNPSLYGGHPMGTGYPLLGAVYQQRQENFDARTLAKTGDLRNYLRELKRGKAQVWENVYLSWNSERAAEK